MATPDKSNPQSRNEHVEAVDPQTTGSPNRGADVETRHVQPEPWSIDDPDLPDRINTVQRQTGAFLQEIQVEPAFGEGLSPEQYRDIHRAAVERASWSPARQNAFRGVLRLARPTPPRAKRVL